MCLGYALVSRTGLRTTAGRASSLGAAPVRRHGDELLPTPWRELVHAVGLASARGEYGKFVMDRQWLGSLPIG